MTNTYNTGNALGSTAAKDLYDNASNLDDAVNSDSPQWTDRFGKRRETLSGQGVLFSSAQLARQQSFDAFLDASGYVWIGDYTAGLTFTRRTQYTIRDGVAYRPSASVSLPFTTTGTWATDQANFVAFDSDAVFAQDLANTSDTTKGVALVGGASRNVANLTALKAVDTSANKQVYRQGYATPGDGGDAFYYFDGASVATPDNVTVVAPNNGAGNWILNHPGYLNARVAGAARNRGDNQVPLQACLDICAASERLKRIHLPADTYSMSGQIQVNGDGITLTGDGRLASVLFQAQLNSNIINVQGPHFTFSGLGIYYAGVPTAGANVVISATSCNGRDFVMANAWNGIELAGGNATACKFTDFDITNYEQSAFYAHEVGDAFISNFLMNAGDTTRGRLGAIRLYNHVEAFVAQQGDILLGVYSLVCDADSNTSGLRPAFNKFTDVYFDSSGYGCLLDKTVETDFNDCWFSGGKPQAGGSNPGLTLMNTVNTKITGGQAFNCGSDGIFISGAARGTVINGTSVESNSATTSTAGGGHGIRLGDGASEFVINGVRAHNGLHPGTQGYGIFLGTSCTEGVIDDCLLSGNLNGAIGGDVAGFAGAIAHCRGFTTLAKGTASIPVDQTVVSITHGLAALPALHDIQVNFGESPVGKGATALYVTNITSTTFQIAANAAVTGTALQVTWRAGVKGN